MHVKNKPCEIISRREIFVEIEYVFAWHIFIADASNELNYQQNSYGSKQYAILSPLPENCSTNKWVHVSLDYVV